MLQAPQRGASLYKEPVELDNASASTTVQCDADQEGEHRDTMNEGLYDH